MKDDSDELRAAFTADERARLRQLRRDAEWCEATMIERQERGMPFSTEAQRARALRWAIDTILASKGVLS